MIIIYLLILFLINFHFVFFFFFKHYNIYQFYFSSRPFLWSWFIMIKSTSCFLFERPFFVCLFILYCLHYFLFSVFSFSFIFFFLLFSFPLFLFLCNCFFLYLRLHIYHQVRVFFFFLPFFCFHFSHMLFSNPILFFALFLLFLGLVTVPTVHYECATPIQLSLLFISPQFHFHTFHIFTLDTICCWVTNTKFHLFQTLLSISLSL